VIFLISNSTDEINNKYYRDICINNNYFEIYNEFNLLVIDKVAPNRASSLGNVLNDKTDEQKRKLIVDDIYALFKNVDENTEVYKYIEELITTHLEQILEQTKQIKEPIMFRPLQPAQPAQQKQERTKQGGKKTRRRRRRQSRKKNRPKNRGTRNHVKRRRKIRTRKLA
jgi:uncharacterized membrane-anchored protein YjiN (DUF445 family)